MKENDEYYQRSGFALPKYIYLYSFDILKMNLKISLFHNSLCYVDEQIAESFIEKIADVEKIIFHLPQVFRDNNSNVAFLGEASKGDKRVWSTGESSSYNNKNPYNFAMAEKRLKDRLVLKIINAYEYGIYSDVEADDFKKAK